MPGVRRLFNLTFVQSSLALSIQVYFQRNEAGGLVGRNGENIKDLTDRAGCDLQVRIFGARKCVRFKKGIPTSNHFRYRVGVVDM